MNIAVKSHTSDAPPVDPIKVELVRGALTSTQFEMGMLLERTAMSPIIREKQDYFCGLFDREGRLLIGTMMPLGGSIVPPVLDVFAREDMREGDVYWYNDCYASQGSVSHSPDEVFVKPVFLDGELVGYTFAWAHFLDIGGAHPGSTTPGATNLFQEGIIIPPVRLYREGQLNEDMFRIFIRNSRFPEVTQGDTRALLAAINLGERRMIEMLERFGVDETERAFDVLIEKTARVVDERMRETFPAGSYSFADRIDSDGHGRENITVRVTLEAAPEGFVFDATASDDQTTGPINFLVHPTVPSMIFGLFMTADRQDLLVNEGMLNAIADVKLREGSVLQPRFPAALGQRAMTLSRLQSACFGLINSATPANAHASSSAYSIAKLGNAPDAARQFLKTMGFGVGHGARPYADGIDAVYYIAQKNYPVEFAEQNYPLRVRRYGIHMDSGGPGLRRGGCGVVRDIEVLADEVEIALRMSNVVNPPYGVVGGMSGRPGGFILNPGRADEKALPALSEALILKRGDVLRTQTPGGGGFGHPFDRDPELVLKDVLGRFVSVEQALRDYGVAVDIERRSIDLAATQAYRDAHRWETKLIHRGEYFESGEWYLALAN